MWFLSAMLQEVSRTRPVHFFENDIMCLNQFRTFVGHPGHSRHVERHARLSYSLFDTTGIFAVTNASITRVGVKIVTFF